MFSHLIESSSHRKEFKRRSSFFLFTTATYALLFAITGVVSIHAYDAKLDDQDLEIVTLMPIVDLLPSTTAPASGSVRPRTTGNNSHQNYDVRRIAVASVNEPRSAPTAVSTTPNPDLPVRPGVAYIIGDRDSNANLPSGPTGTQGSSRVSERLNIEAELGAPPPAPTLPPVNKIVKVTKVLNSQALLLPKPIYPILAKQIGLQGTVSVQVLIDEKGNVMSAKAISGHPFLVPEAQKAALQARFSPTTISDQAVKVSGVITYNFVLQ